MPPGLEIAALPASDGTLPLLASGYIATVSRLGSVAKMAGPSFGIGVVLALAAATREASVTSTWASLISLEGPRNKPSKTRTKIKACKVPRDRGLPRSTRSSLDGAECFSGIAAMDVSPFRDRLI